ncbi:MAG: TRAM domain-containing protein [bacterium]|nr:TRAM domain-containing protein [bacterium]
MGITLIRFIFIIISGLLSYRLTNQLFTKLSPYIGTTIGVLIALIIIAAEERLKKVSLKNILIIILGLAAGLTLANLAFTLFLPINNEELAIFVRIFLNLICGYFGITLAVKKGGDLTILGSNIIIGPRDQMFSYKILDTNVIIDGRIAEIVESGFLEGTLVIPQFVLNELHHIADSADSQKRTRGRRGLDILNKIQKKQNLKVEISDKNFPDIREVDAKLVALAKSLSCPVVTNDYNLNKIAELQGVRVLNINDLANAVKPIVLPGETMHVRIIKEGKEFSQGIGYMDDGTMIVVDNGKRYVGQKVDALVTSVLQNTAGRMIFAQFKQELKNEENK